jgi:hypothetical protein
MIPEPAPEKIGPTDKLYLVTHEELLPGEQAVQAAHALREFAQHHPELDQLWYRRSNYLALLAAPSCEALVLLRDQVEQIGLPFAAFYEPDKGGALTAIAVGPSKKAKRLLAGLPLALQGSLSPRL